MSDPIATVTLPQRGAGRNASVSQTPDPATLYRGDSIPVNVGTGFNGTGTIQSVTFYADDNGQRGTTLGTWNRSDPDTQPIAEKFNVAVNGDQNVTITDEELFSGTADQEKFHYCVSVEDIDGFHSADPVLLNRKSLDH